MASLVRETESIFRVTDLIRTLMKRVNYAGLELESHVGQVRMVSFPVGLIVFIRQSASFMNKSLQAGPTNINYSFSLYNGKFLIAIKLVILQFSVTAYSLCL